MYMYEHTVHAYHTNLLVSWARHNIIYMYIVYTCTYFITHKTTHLFIYIYMYVYTCIYYVYCIPQSKHTVMIQWIPDIVHREDILLHFQWVIWQLQLPVLYIQCMWIHSHLDVQLTQAERERTDLHVCPGSNSGSMTWIPVHKPPNTNPSHSFVCAWHVIRSLPVTPAQLVLAENMSCTLGDFQF